MTIEELSGKIHLQEPVMTEVLRIAADFDFTGVEELLRDIKIPGRWEAARKELERRLAPDEKQFKMLVCMLQCAVGDYAEYKKLGISDEIYIATMGCFTRFLGEAKKRTGEYIFDRSFWTVRQIGMQLFRIGSLEYEKTVFNGKPVISIHIPSDADLSPEACDASLKRAEIFMKEKILGNVSCSYICSSWLLSPALKEMLPADSKIIRFQERFRLIYENPDSTDYLEWVFQTGQCAPETLPEHTTLQKKMKAYLLSGKKVGEALGVLKAGTA